MSTLVGVDIVGIQGYLAASPRLAHIRAASRAVADATRADGPMVGALVRARWASGGALLRPGEVLLGAGGNLVLEMDAPERAKAVSTFIGAWLAKKAPGLEAAVAHVARHGEALGVDLRSLFDTELPAAKLARRSPTGWVPAQVAVDPSTGRAITGVGRHREAVAEAQQAQEQQGAPEHRHWDSFLPPGCRFGTEESWRSRGEQSWYAVVHLDGDGIGAKIGKWFDDHEDEADERFRHAYRGLAQDLHGAAEASFRAVCQDLSAASEGGCVPGTETIEAIPCPDEHGKRGLPIRPVLVAGDDVTFLCDARVALWAAVRASQAFSVEVEGLGPVTASAGIGYASAHSPADRALVAADRACRDAKQSRRSGLTETGPALGWSGLDARSEAPLTLSLRDARSIAQDLDRLREPPWSGRHAATKAVLSLAAQEHRGQAAQGATSVELGRWTDRSEEPFPITDVTHLARLAEHLDLSLFPSALVASGGAGAR